jgi:hypothetical protein
VTMGSDAQEDDLIYEVPEEQQLAFEYHEPAVFIFTFNGPSSKDVKDWCAGQTVSVWEDFGRIYGSKLTHFGIVGKMNDDQKALFKSTFSTVLGK